MATWPATLPAATFDSYAIESGDPTVRTDLESGPARVRRRFTAAPDNVTLRFVFDENQMATFRTFWDGDAQQGAAWFNLTMRTGRSAGLVTKEVRPVPARFNADLLGAGVWAVSFKVEVRNA